MLKRLLIIIGVLGLLVFYGIPYIPYTYDYEAEKQTGLASGIVESRISHFALCILDVYTMVETDENNENLKTTTCIQFNNNATAKITTITVGHNADNPAEEKVEEDVVYYKVINNRIYMSYEKNFRVTDTESYSYFIENFYTVKEKGNTLAFTSNIAVGVTMVFAGMIVLGLIFFAIKKQHEK